MAQTVKELVALGLSEAEAKRVINRNAKAAEKSEGAKARAEKRLPKAREVAAHAAARAAHWADVSAKAEAKVAKYEAIAAGESTEEVEDDSE